MKEITKCFKALSDSNRLRILKMLEIRSLCVCEITENLGLANSTVSKHLYILREAGFITDHKEGKWVNYRLNQQENAPQVRVLLPLLSAWLANDSTVRLDQERTKTVDRLVICKN